MFFFHVRWKKFISSFLSAKQLIQNNSNIPLFEMGVAIRKFSDVLKFYPKKVKSFKIHTLIQAK
jgi:hypothetical protein